MTLYEKFFKPFPIFKTRRLVLRPVQQNDLYDLYEFCRREEVARYLSWYAHADINATRAYISFLQQCYKSGCGTTWAVERQRDKKVIGTCSYATIDPLYKTAEIGYVLSSDVWGKGYAVEASYCLMNYGFTVIGFRRIQAKCMCENQASVRVMQKLGMLYEGKLRNGVFCKNTARDVYLYALTDQDFYNEKALK